MSSENSALKKTLFGGFKKEDVFSLFENLQNENIKLKSEIDKLQSVRSQAMVLEKKLEEKDRYIRQLEEKNAKQSDEYAMLSLEAEAAKSAETEYDAKLEACRQKVLLIEQKFNVIQSKYDKYGDIEAYENNVRLSAENMTKSARSTLATAYAKISEANEKLKSCFNEFSTVSEGIGSDMNLLMDLISGTLSEIPGGKNDENT